MQTITTHYLIIGSGIAGLTLAIKLAECYPHKTITIVTKSKVEESNTKYAQGGVAVVLNQLLDSFDKHIEDTLKAGDGLCNLETVERVITKGPGCFNTLLEWGSQFDKNTKGEFDLGREGGHSEHRVVHHKDITGFEIERSLLEKIQSLSNIKVLEHHFAIDLIVHHQEDLSHCSGAYILNQNSKEQLCILAESTVLATGGIGQIYGHTTNPLVATGDGVAMASRAKADISHMEFIQFHPTVLHNQPKTQAFLISEAVRGFGAHLKTAQGKRFMFLYDERGELASRDIVSQAIYTVLEQTGDHCVYLDCTHLNMDEFKIHFPNIYNYCLDQGIDLSKDWIPVVPASHYLCGGIDVNSNGETTIKHLFACGECSNTGLHGANRLASNSLLEALVYAHQIFGYLRLHPISSTHISTPPQQDSKRIKPTNLKAINNALKQVQKLMRTHAGIVRSNEGLQSTLKQLHLISLQIEQLFNHSILDSKLLEVRNVIETATLIVLQSINRQENRGGFYNKDLI